MSSSVRLAPQRWLTLISLLNGVATLVPLVPLVIGVVFGRGVTARVVSAMVSVFTGRGGVNAVLGDDEVGSGDAGVLTETT